mmetsp:Transcript_26755/g.32476  ORF Transcript_26755/g.32476 Transcript_26755/m.32476 type:complete len:507 (-) Transcript_26755:419-1939(-)|eukprot:CAMPEP_0197848220 /NCGR_PEP_ID=MMETSP1438-20131217/7989_1 /TAXON_ID=1461541 /ORGANISM="Pterosperma sp., Strain CCMP1384" /LENGTH=506 /DNA_ID=CAMNT_0043460363 /DNA_START=94 /DNA_END=1614 /DNA_ORIENTATION=-
MGGDKKVKILIVGAGPTGLGAATRLHQLGNTDWELIDEAPEAGGLACTDCTPEGFLFDMGGHVIFSHYQYFDDLLDTAVGKEEWNTLQRVSYVRLKDRWIAYPFQNNISALDVEDQVKCLTGCVEAKVLNATTTEKPKSFDEWILRVMGPGIADIFMRPYNFKVWGVPTTHMQCDWLGERVATVDVTKAISNVLHNKEDAGWGPNAVFRFPKKGGTGGIWKAVASLLPQEKMSFGSGNRVVGIDEEKKEAKLKDGSTIQFEKLLTTIPLDLTLSMVGKQEWADGLTHSNSHIIGVGIRGLNPHDTKCWLYFPEDNCPFYRATIFSHYAEENCPAADVKLPTMCVGAGGPVGGDASPKGGPYHSLMFEVCESAMKKVEQDSVTLGGTAGTWSRVVLDTLVGAINTSLMTADAEIVSLYHRRIEHGYPTPSLGRDAVLKEALPYLREKNIWSRGRFGSYKYEVANQDHSLMLGVECVDNMLNGSMELTLNHPNIVNATKNKELLYHKN